jgi:hypothetical protein
VSNSAAWARPGAESGGGDGRRGGGRGGRRGRGGGGGAVQGVEVVRVVVPVRRWRKGAGMYRTLFLYVYRTLFCTCIGHYFVRWKLLRNCHLRWKLLFRNIYVGNYCLGNYCLRWKLLFI